MDAANRRRATSPDDVIEQFDEIWRAAATDEQALVRACLVNLVVVCASDDVELIRATALVRQVAETVPGRALVIGPPRTDATEEFEVFVSAHCHRGSGSTQVCSEQVSIQPTLATLDRVRPTVLQLLVEDMPVHTWWRRGELDPATLLEPLVELSDCLVLDSASSTRPLAHLADLVALTRRKNWRGRLADLAWVRLEPWRDAIASFFDNPSLSGALTGITRVRIAASEVAGAYLAGWLVSRMSLRRDGRRWVGGEGQPVEIAFATGDGVGAGEVRSVTIEARHRDAALVLDTTLEGPDCLRISVGAGAHGLPVKRMRLPAGDEASLLCGVLQRSGSDTVYRQALRAAADCASPPC